MCGLKNLYVLLGVSIMFSPLVARSQEDAPPPPTLKLDRVMSSPAFSGQTRAPGAPVSAFRVETLATGLSTPWALAFLPGGDILISEYSGALRILRAGDLSGPLTGLPEISQEGWAGLFDIVLDPAFTDNHLVYFSYTAPSGDAASPTVPRIARAKIDTVELALTGLLILADGYAWQELHFAVDGQLLASGVSHDAEADAQDLSSYSGKLLRVNPDGTFPQDNPWSGDDAVSSGIYTLGHRDISGMATRPDSGDIWITEHGPRGGDELNRIKAGANYGWPLISYGTEYSGVAVGEGATASEGMEQPRYFWRPSIAPSGLMFYSGNMFPEWTGNVFVTSLSGQHISRLVLEGDNVVAEERLLLDREQRIRELKQGPDGALYALTNEESDAPTGTGELLRIFK